jgi:hypothetical protein
MNIQLPTGNTISISAYEYLFVLKDEDVELFYQSCMADNIGVYIDNPFSNRAHSGTIDESEELSDDPSFSL